MPYAKITYLPVDQPDEAEWADYEHLMNRWQGLSKSTAKAWATEMRDNPRFRDGVINPSHKLVFINYDVFKEFLSWKQATRYRKNKK